jgi:hypothetical protein
VNRLAAAAALLSACARSNLSVIEELEARREEAPALREAAGGGRGPATPREPLAAVELPLLPCRLPAVDGAANGIPMPVLLDTGSSVVMLTGPAARRCGLFVLRGDAREVIAPRGGLRARAAALEELSIGPLRFGPVHALLPERERRLAPSSLRHDGAYVVAGCSVLGHFRVTFDFARRVVRLEPHGGRGGFDPLVATVRLDGRALPLLVDSGADGLFLEPWAAEATGIGPLAVEIEGFRLPRVRPRVLETFTKADPGPLRPAGLLGLAAFGARAWTLDFSRGRLAVSGDA